MSTLRNLKAIKNKPLVKKNKSDDEMSEDEDRALPLFAEFEKDEIDDLKAEAQKYSRFAPVEWFDKLIQEETAISAESLEGCLDPLEVIIEYWTNAIQVGKTYEELNFYKNKALNIAHALEQNGILDLRTAHNCIRDAINSSPVVKISLLNLKAVLAEYEKALTRAR
jgi:hypothetical protein